MASVCHHGIPLFHVSLWTPREQQFYAFALLSMLLEHLPNSGRLDVFMTLDARFTVLFISGICFRMEGMSQLGCINFPCIQCRQEIGSMLNLPMEISFGHQNISLSSQVRNPIIGRIFVGNPSSWFSKCFPNRDVIIS